MPELWRTRQCSDASMECVILKKKNSSPLTDFRGAAGPGIWRLEPTKPCPPYQIIDSPLRSAKPQNLVSLAPPFSVGTSRKHIGLRLNLEMNTFPRAQSRGLSRIGPLERAGQDGPSESQRTRTGLASAPAAHQAEHRSRWLASR